MLKYIAAACAALIASSALAQDYPLKAERPKPATSSIVIVCENRSPKLMVVVLTYENGKVLVVDSKNMNGFSSAQEVMSYAETAGQVGEYVQTCGDAAT